MKTYSKCFGGLLDLDGKVIANTLVGRHDFNKVGDLGIFSQLLEGVQIVEVHIALLGNLTSSFSDKFSLQHDNLC